MASTEEQHQENSTISPEPDVNFGSAPTGGVTKPDGISIAGTPEPGNTDSPSIPENSGDLSKNEGLGAKNRAETDELINATPPGNKTIDKPQASFSNSHPMQASSSEPSNSSRNCEILRTYSTISTPFLAGGELKLPNIFSAILKCGATLTDSIRNWSKEIADEACDETKRLSLVQLNAAPGSGIATATTTIIIASTSKEDPGTSLKTGSILGAGKPETPERKANSVQRGSTGFAITEDLAIKHATKQVLTTASSVDVVATSDPVILSTLEPYNKPQSLQKDQALTERSSFRFTPENTEDRGRKESKSFQSTRSASVLSIHPVAAEVNLSQLKRNSVPDVPAGVAGFRNLCVTRTTTTRTQDSGINTHGSDKDFIDLFAEKNCVRFITVLEDIESFFKRRVASETEAMPLSMVSESNDILMKIQALTKITPVDKEKELHDYDFPLILRHDVAKFDIDASKKLDIVLQIHNYGVKMILHWIYLLQDRVSIPPETICSVGTELLSSIMIPCYGIFVVIGESLMKMTDGSISKLHHQSLDKLLRNFRNLMDTISDELGAIGESGAQILIRTPNVSHERVEENLKRLYLQVNYAEVALSRVMEALVPLIHSYAIKELMSPNKRKDT